MITMPDILIEIRIIGSFIAIDNREKSWDCPSSSNNPVVSDNRRSDNRDLTVLITGSGKSGPVDFELARSDCMMI